MQRAMNVSMPVARSTLSEMFGYDYLLSWEQLTLNHGIFGGNWPRYLNRYRFFLEQEI